MRVKRKIKNKSAPKMQVIQPAYPDWSYEKISVEDCAREEYTPQIHMATEYPPDFLSLEEAANELGVSTNTVRKFFILGKLKGKRIKRKIYIKQKSLEMYKVLQDARES